MASSRLGARCRRIRVGRDTGRLACVQRYSALCVCAVWYGIISACVWPDLDATDVRDVKGQTRQAG